VIFPGNLVRLAPDIVVTELTIWRSNDSHDTAVVGRFKADDVGIVVQVARARRTTRTGSRLALVHCRHGWGWVDESFLESA
jgi:hypothetical protein